MAEDQVRGAPEAALRRWVSYRGYDLRTGGPGRHRGLPSPYLTLVVTFDDVPVTVVDADGRAHRRAAVLGGLHDTPITIAHDGRQAGLHVSLHPLAARVLLGMPAAELAGLDLDPSDVLGRLGDELAERVGGADGWATRFAAVDDVLSRRLDAPPTAPRPEVRRAWGALLQGRRIADVADEVGWSERHLTQSLRAEVGTTPKVLGRMARFDRARRRIAGRAARGEALDLADVAAAGGFADQAHLNREFRAFAGASPTRWLADEQRTV